MTVSELIRFVIMNSALSNNLFFFAARDVTPWTNEAVAPDVSTLVHSDFEDEMIFLKKINMKDIRFIVDRYDWAAGTYSLNDIVITEDFKIYQCDNAGTSTAKPTHIAGSVVDITGTASWEYLETTPFEDRIYFLTDDFVSLTMKSEKIFYTDKIVSLVIVVNVIGTEDGMLPLDRKYRVAGVYLNPIIRTDKSNVKGNNDFNSLGNIFTFTSLIPQIRTADQIDTFVFSAVL